MKRFLVLLCVLALAFTLIAGCSSQEETPKETGAAGHPEEVADSTRLDSAVADTLTVDSVEPAADTSVEGQ